MFRPKKNVVFQVMEFQNRTVEDLFLFSSEFLYGDDRETICPNGEILWNPNKILKKR